MANAKPIILWKNLAKAATLSAAAAASGFPAANVADFRSSLIWTGSGTADTWLKADFGAGAHQEAPWADDGSSGFDVWAETDANSTMICNGSGVIVYDSAANAADAPYIELADPVLGEYNTIEVDFYDLAYATATEQYFYLWQQFATNKYIVIRGEWDSGIAKWKASVYYKTGAGAEQSGETVLFPAGETSCRLRMVNLAGTVKVYAYTVSNTTWNLIDTITDNGFAITTPTEIWLGASLDTRSAGSFEWKSSGFYHADLTAPVEALALSGHDLYTQAAENILLQISMDGTIWQTVVSAFTPAGDGPLYKSATPSAARYYRLWIPTGYTAAPSIANWFIGPKLQFPRWITGKYNPWKRSRKAQNNKSRTGQILETIYQYTEYEADLTFKGLTEAFYLASLKPFEDNLSTDDIFYYVWDETNHPTEVYLCQVEANADLGFVLGNNSGEWSIKARGVI